MGKERNAIELFAIHYTLSIDRYTTSGRTMMEKRFDDIQRHSRIKNQDGLHEMHDILCGGYYGVIKTSKHEKLSTRIDFEVLSRKGAKNVTFAESEKDKKLELRNGCSATTRTHLSNRLLWTY